VTDYEALKSASVPRSMWLRYARMLEPLIDVFAYGFLGLPVAAIVPFMLMDLLPRSFVAAVGLPGHRGLYSMSFWVLFQVRACLMFAAARRLIRDGVFVDATIEKVREFTDRRRTGRGTTVILRRPAEAGGGTFGFSVNGSRKLEAGDKVPALLVPNSQYCAVVSVHRPDHLR
jgi:hypothetical protein